MLRVALYSHDTMGLGHMRRNLLIAQSLIKSFSDVTVLLITGAKEANAFAVPPGVDCLTLPSVGKDREGGYHSRSLRMTLPKLIELRSLAIRSAVEVFDPDIFLVDKVPRGIEDELLPTLEAMRYRRDARCILGLRDVLDDKAVTLENWRKTRALDVIRQYFHAVWVYGDPHVFDLVNEYELPGDIAAKVEFTGYLDQRERAMNAGHCPPEWAKDIPESPFDLCLVGGGQDGARLAFTFADATESADTPSVLVTGPFMPGEARTELMRRAVERTNLKVLEFVPEADWLIQRASKIVCMGGYNTTSSVVSFAKPALVVPRVEPRREQLMRARRFRDLGLIDMVHPHDLDASTMRKWLSTKTSFCSEIRQRVDLGGLPAIGNLIGTLVPDARRRTHQPDGYSHDSRQNRARRVCR